MKVLKNSRQVPDVEKYTANKDYCDLLYCYLQERSFLDIDGNRYIAKKDVVFNHIAEDLKKNRQTISKYFTKLMDMGLIELTDDGKYYQLKYLDKSLSALVPLKTLRIINNTLRQRCVSVYVYLLKRYCASGDKPYTVTLSQIKTFVGLSTKTRSNDEIIDDILLVLKKIGLINYKVVQVEEKKANIVITMVTNEISD